MEKNEIHQNLARIEKKFGNLDFTKINVDFSDLQFTFIKKGSVLIDGNSTKNFNLKIIRLKYALSLASKGFKT